MSFSDLSIPTPAEVTPAWMTTVLNRAGHSAVVTDLSAKRVGTGQVGESYRFTLSYRGDPGGAPATVVGKFPASDPISRAAGVNFGNYVREVRFYRELQASALVSTPVCLHAQVDPATCDFVLIMEDLAPAVAGDQLRGVSIDEAVLALDEAAKLHGSHWNDPAIDKMAWISGTSLATPQLGSDGATQLWHGFLERYGDRVTADHRRVGEAVVARFEKATQAKTGPKCLIHMDFRPDNMMFASAQGGRPITVVDWQSLGWGNCMGDVSYFLAGAVGLDARRAHEREMLKAYHRRLVSLGVDDYSFDDVWRDYAKNSFALFNMGFIASMVVERTARGDDMFFQMVESGANLVLDLDAIALLNAD